MRIESWLKLLSHCWRWKSNGVLFCSLNIFFSLSLSHRSFVPFISVQNCVLCVCVPVFVRYSHYWCIGGFLNHIRIIVNNPYTRVIVSDCRIDLCCSTTARQTQWENEKSSGEWQWNERDRAWASTGFQCYRRWVNNANERGWNKTKSNNPSSLLFYIGFNAERLSVDLLLALRLVLWRVANNIYVRLLLSKWQWWWCNNRLTVQWFKCREKQPFKSMKRSKHGPITANKLTTSATTKLN